MQDRAERQHVDGHSPSRRSMSGSVSTRRLIDALWRDYEEDATPFLLLAEGLSGCSISSAFRPQVHRASAQDYSRLMAADEAGDARAPEGAPRGAARNRRSPDIAAASSS